MSARRGASLVLALLLLSPAQLWPQAPEHFGAATPRSIAAALDATGKPGFARLVLRQQYGNANAAERDSIADVLVKFVLRHSSDTSKFDAVSEAVGVLSVAGLEGTPGTPYAGAVAALMRIVRVDTTYAWAHVITALPQQSERAEALAGLLEIARYDRFWARFAVEQLARSLSPELYAGLTLLCEGAPLPNAGAEQVLQFYSWLSYQRTGRCATHAGQEDSSLALAVEEWQTMRRNRLAVLTLRQTRGTSTAAERDSIAESFTVLAIEASRVPAQVGHAGTLVGFLAQSGSEYGGGVPYAGAVKLLTRIARTAGDSVAVQAASALTNLRPQSDAADSLAVLARLPSPVAYTAVLRLTESLNLHFRAAVASLCRGAPLPNSDAEAHLQADARRREVNFERCRP